MKKNILIMGLGKQFGGTEKYIINIIENINYNDFDVHICTNKDSLLCKKLKLANYKNIKIIEIEGSKKSIIKNARKIKKYIIENKIQVIHNNGVLTELITFLATNKLKSLTKISTVHGFSSFDRMDRSRFERFVFEFLEKIMFKYSCKYIAVSDSIKEYLIKRGLEEEKIIVIHHGVHKSKEVIYNERNNKEEFITVGSVGRLEVVKGYEYLVNAIKILTDKKYNIKCNIAGEGLEIERLSRLVSELGMQNNINFVGFTDKVNEFLQGVDIYVQPSIQESFGISILEAMNMSRPVIASNVGGIPEIIQNDKNGLLFESRNYIDLADKIEQLIIDEDKRILIAKEGRIRFVNNFTIEVFIEKLSNIYNI